MNRILVNYNGGAACIGSLKVLAWLSAAAGFLGALYLIGPQSADSPWDYALAGAVFVSGLFTLAVLNALAFIAECAAYVAQNTPLYIRQSTKPVSESSD